MIPNDPPGLGRHRLLAEIGRGGMADVYLAVARGPAGFSKLVVVKQLRGSFEADAEILAMFLDEARLAARLNHPNVVQTLEVGEDAGRHYLVMEYLDGQPLQRVYGRLREDLALGTRLRILGEVLAGLHYAHELVDYDGTPLGIVHRDVSPHNVIVTYDGSVKLVDFGIAKANDSQSETRTGVLKGKIVYMAPEQARGERVDRRADVFSVGMMIWEAVAGKRMWKGKTDLAILPDLIRGEIQDLAVAAPDAPAALVEVTRRALAFDPADRHPTALALQRDLDEAIETLGGAGGVRELGTKLGEAFSDHRTRVRAIVDEQLRRLRLTEGERPASLPRVELDPISLVTGADREESTQRSSPHARRRADSQAAVALSSGAVPMPQRASRPLARRLAVTFAIAASVVAASGVGWFVSRRAVPATASPARTAPAAPEIRACDAASKPLVEITGELDSDVTLRCENDYLLKFTVFVRAGATLVIEPGTTIKGDKATKGTLVVQQGGRILARGERDRPIVFTSEAPPSERKAGDWGGVIVLGRAPTNLRDASGKPTRGRVEGITSGGLYGGDDPDDDSGVLRYVRIEYSGVAIGPNNEINGLTLGGVGRRTKIDHVMVRQTADDCFEFFGGTVDAKHLICQYNGDDGFDWDYGYRGRLQFLFLQQDPAVVDDTNGLEGDNDPNGSGNTPVSEPTIYNATLCGMGREAPKEQYGILLRRGTRAHLANLIVTGFEAGIDVRDARTVPDVRSSIFFGNLVHPIAHPEGVGPGSARDDDDGLDEIAFVLDPKRGNSLANPGLPDCFDPAEPRAAPASPLTKGAATPPDDGFFDPGARYIGAFRDASDDWATGAWVSFGAR